jgi:hypothetical protein
MKLNGQNAYSVDTAGTTEEYKTTLIDYHQRRLFDELSHSVGSLLTSRQRPAKPIEGFTADRQESYMPDCDYTELVWFPIDQTGFADAVADFEKRACHSERVHSMHLAKMASTSVFFRIGKVVTHNCLLFRVSPPANPTWHLSSM